MEKFYAIQKFVPFEVAIFDYKQDRDEWVAYEDEVSKQFYLPEDMAASPRLAISEETAAILSCDNIFNPDAISESEIGEKMRWAYGNFLSQMQEAEEASRDKRYFAIFKNDPGEVAIFDNEADRDEWVAYHDAFSKTEYNAEDAKRMPRVAITRREALLNSCGNIDRPSAVLPDDFGGKMHWAFATYRGAETNG